MKKLSTILFGFLFLVPTLIYAQGWEKTYDGGYNEEVKASDKTPDGGIIMFGTQSGIVSGLDKVFLYETDSLGNLIWEYYNDTYAGDEVEAYDVLTTSDSNYLVTFTYSFQGVDTSVVQKITPAGVVLWEDILPVLDENPVSELAETPNGGYITAGKYTPFEPEARVAKLDNNGNQVWEISYLYNANQKVTPTDLHVATNGDILMLATVPSTQTNGIEVLVVRFDNEGNVIWEQDYSFSQYSNPAEIIELSSGEFVIGGSGAPDLNPDFPILIKIDATGNVIWQKSYYFLEFEKHQVVTGLRETEDGGFVFLGNILDMSTWTARELFLTKVDSEGNELWKKTYGSQMHELSANVFLADDKGFYLTGSTQVSENTYNAYLIKTDSLGISLPNQLNGNIYVDENLDCELNPSEMGLSQWMIEAKKNDIRYITLTDSLGNFDFTLDTGIYQITTYPPSPYWGICNNGFTVEYTGIFESQTENIGAQAIIDCPLLDVSIGTPSLRRCFENTYTVQYCNDGTVTAEDAYVEIDFDSDMIIQNSSIPIASQVGNFLTFDLGDVPINECGSFTVDILLGDSTTCDSIPFGATHCVEAHIYPDSICLPSNNWSGASIEVDANCIGDSIHFLIRNVGSAPTQPGLQYWVIEDDVILYFQGFGLNSNQVLPVSVKGTGATYRLEVDQEPNHPGMSMPSVSVEGCTINNPTPTLGFISIFFQDDGDTFVDVDCQQNVGAYDPNDKQGFPLGYGFEKYISRGQDIEYMIRFQNTGTDTAFNIVVLDKLSEFLDITTIRAGASSHPYEFDILDDRTLSFKFDNIMLPDSNVNQYASNGFVKFKVEQMPDLDLETEIHNTAAIYFDFNPPIFTNQTLHTVGENYIMVSINPVEKSLAEVKVYPNPFSVETKIEINDVDIDEGVFKLYDTTGRLMRVQKFDSNQFIFSKKDLRAGMYFFTIENNGQLISSGKLTAQ